VSYLDVLEPVYAKVGYGSLGTQGRLGYEDGLVRVRGERFSHALSTHPPARLVYDLGGAFNRFHCWVGLTDEVPAGCSYADFSVRGDGRELALVPSVWAGAGPVEVSVGVGGTQFLELGVTTGRWEHCHAVWLEPLLDGGEAVSAATLADCLGRADMTVSAVRPRARRCIATVASAGYGGLLDDMLGSVHANGGCGDALVVVIALSVDGVVTEVATKYGATMIRATPRGRPNVASKSLLYSIARLVDAERFICLDADTLVLSSLEPLFGALEACAEDSVLACREGNHHGFSDVAHIVSTAYGGAPGDVERIVGADVGGYPLVVNDGVFAGSRSALLALDAAIRAMPGAVAWCDERPKLAWRNQAIFNLALARLRCGVELDAAWNVQLHAQDVEVSMGGGRPRATWQGRDVRVLHLSGTGRGKVPALRGMYASVPDPLGSDGDGAYDAFVRALRAWVGRHGVAALAWSFYGTPTGYARVRDRGAFPLFGLLHYLIRSNGCVRVVETGTARGVSAACIASAVAHREGGKVVSFDPEDFPERAGLWEALPASMRACLEARRTGSLEGMAEALRAGERYHAALLDSSHAGEHVWAEFELARRLVVPGGLILVHDPGLEGQTVPWALARIRAAGYDVTRLWAGEGTEPEDEGLQLAVIENRRG
jgi:predicted O-methyltransferase YrrM